MTSSPLRVGATLEQELEYYKKQYEQLEADLADFQASSKELEEQLEKDVDVAEKNERKLKEQVEKLGYEVDEWKGKHKQSKTEANNAHNTLQKEITSMRESNRGLQMKLRDIEVSNDDYERQARNTTSSLEDLENKLNQSIERGVMLDEEMKIGEQEREGLRIECQRLRDELGDLKVENEITVEKLRSAESTIDNLRAGGRKPSSMAVENLRARSPVGSDASVITPSSPTASTPPPKSDSSARSDAQTPPSPPLSDVAASGNPQPKTPLPAKRRSLIPDLSATPRAAPHGPRAPPTHSRGPSMASSQGRADSKAMRPPTSRPTRPTSRPSIAPAELPRSDSLYQIRGLIGRMQKIEERVHSARSKLPPPRDTTPKPSPLAGSANADDIPSSVTVRRSSKRPSVTPGAVSSVVYGEEGEANNDRLRPSSRRDSHIKRLSYGIPRPASSASERPPSALSNVRPSSSHGRERPPSALGRERPPSSHGRERPPSAMSRERPPSSHGRERPPSALGMERPASSASRPSSRASFVSSGRPSSRLDGARAGYAGTSSNNNAATPRPRSSMAGNYATISGTPRSSLHRPSASVSGLRHKAAESEDSGLAGLFTPSGRRTTLDRSGLPQPGASKRQSGGIPSTVRGTGRRKSMTGGEMKPPPSRKKMSDVGETF